jgi:hypothetical protein
MTVAGEWLWLEFGKCFSSSPTRWVVVRWLLCGCFGLGVVIRWAGKSLPKFMQGKKIARARIRAFKRIRIVLRTPEVVRLAAAVRARSRFVNCMIVAARLASMSFCGLLSVSEGPVRDDRR